MIWEPSLGMGDPNFSLHRPLAFFVRRLLKSAQIQAEVAMCVISSIFLRLWEWELGNRRNEAEAELKKVLC
jgi:hypothetical protein